MATVYADQASLDRQNEIETLNNRIEQLEYAQESMLGAEVTLKLDSQIARSLLDYRTVVAAGRLDAAESRGQELRSLVLKRDYTYSGTEDLSGQLQELKNQLKTLRSQAANSVKTIRSPPVRFVFRRGGRLRIRSDAGQFVHADSQCSE